MLRKNQVAHQINVEGIVVDVIRKNIKHLHLTVCPPDGRVRVSAPLRTGDAAIAGVVAGRMVWIKRHQEQIRRQAVSAPHEHVTGEIHEFGGQRYVLNVIEQPGPGKVVLRDNGRGDRAAGDHRRGDHAARDRGRGDPVWSPPPEAGADALPPVLDLYVRTGSNAGQRAAVLQAWYRAELKAQVPPLLAKWQPVIGVETAVWGVKIMKTRWGTCNTLKRRIWLNLELAKKPPHLLEYVVVHELVHLLERGHGARFRAHMDRVLPGWRRLRAELNGKAAARG